MTLQDKSRQQASTPEFMKLYNDSVTDGMNERRACDGDLHSEYILYCQGDRPWRPEFSQFLAKEK